MLTSAYGVYDSFMSHTVKPGVNPSYKLLFTWCSMDTPRSGVLSDSHALLHPRQVGALAVIRRAFEVPANSRFLRYAGLHILDLALFKGRTGAASLRYSDSSADLLRHGGRHHARAR